jgi:hypothetical protein
VSEPSVLLTERSEVRAIVSVSVAVLLPGVASETVAGTATVAVLASEPDAAALSVATTVYVAVPLTARLAVVLMLPLPDAATQVDPAVATHVQVAPVSVAGNVSVIVAPVTNDGPLLVATIVYVTPLPAVTVATPSVLVIERSAAGANVLVSVAVLLPGASVTPIGAVMAALLTNVPVAVAAMLAVTV